LSFVSVSFGSEMAVRLVPPRGAQKGAFRGGPEWRHYNSDD
jgi:hypothetical protein